MTQLRAALYLRVSTAKQAEQDISIPDQQRQGELFCEARGYQVTQVYVEPGASATSDKRPEFQRMIEDGTAKPPAYDVIVVHSFSRFFRDHFELEFYVRKLAKNGVKLVSITQDIGDDPVHVMMRQIMALFDEYQSKENAKHTLRAMKENARQGFWNGARPPIGYRLALAETRGLRQKKKLEIDPLHADTVRLMFRLASRGNGDGPMGVKAIARFLNENEIFTRSGARWGLGAVYQILTRKTYVGTHEFNRTNKDGKSNAKADVIAVQVPPLIEQDLFDAVQTRLRSRSPLVVPPGVVSASSLLTGIIFCADCGGAMTIATGKGGRYRYYACGNRFRKGATACSSSNIRADHLEERIISFIEERLLEPTRLKAILSAMLHGRRERAVEQQQFVADLRKKAAEAQQKLSRMYQAIENGVADVGDVEFAQRISALKLARDQANLDAQRASDALEVATGKAITSDLLGEFADRVRGRLRGESGKYRRDHLHQFAQRIEVDKQAIRIAGEKNSLLSSLVALGSVQQKDVVPSAVLKWLPG